MTQILASIMDAIGRVRTNPHLEQYDKGLIIPLLESCLAEHASGDIPIR